MVVQEESTTVQAMRALQSLEDSWEFCSMIVNYPCKDHLSIFYFDEKRQFFQRIFKPNGETADELLLETNAENKA
jgi:hypothetical protein